MKAKELMIGDWVCYRGYGIARRVKIISEKLVMLDNSKWYSPSNFRPIPLTPELLEKNGFHFGYTSNEEDFAASVSGHLDPDLKGWVWDEGAGAIKVQFPTESDGGQVSIYGDSYLTIVFDEVIYVHQLQHLINLCGVEKEIKL